MLEKHKRIEVYTEDAHRGVLLALSPDIENSPQRVHERVLRGGGKANPQYTA